ncbi:MAG: hypothetical protein AAFY81_09345 [Pseudomonadota bacterium]
MSLLATSLLLASAPVVGTVPTPNAELDAAHTCLAAGAKAWLKEFSWQPETDERWRWATRIVEGCESEVQAAADSPEAMALQPNPTSIVGSGGVSKRTALRSEALYYVDRLIREHFEKQP